MRFQNSNMKQPESQQTGFVSLSFLIFDPLLHLSWATRVPGEWSGWTASGHPEESDEQLALWHSLLPRQPPSPGHTSGSGWNGSGRCSCGARIVWGRSCNLRQRHLRLFPRKIWGGSLCWEVPFLKTTVLARTCNVHHDPSARRQRSCGHVFACVLFLCSTGTRFEKKKHVETTSSPASFSIVWKVAGVRNTNTPPRARWSHHLYLMMRRLVDKNR